MLVINVCSTSRVKKKGNQKLCRSQRLPRQRRRCRRTGEGRGCPVPLGRLNHRNGSSTASFWHSGKRALLRDQGRRLQATPWRLCSARSPKARRASEGPLSPSPSCPSTQGSCGLIVLTPCSDHGCPSRPVPSYFLLCMRFLGPGVTRRAHPPRVLASRCRVNPEALVTALGSPRASLGLCSIETWPCPKGRKSSDGPHTSGPGVGLLVRQHRSQ